MRFSHTLRLTAAAGLGAAALTVVGAAAPAQARVADPATDCLTPTPNPVAAGARGGATGLDHRDISVAEQRAIARRTDSRLAAKGASSVSGSGASAVTVPVYVHVMRDDAGRGDVANRQITRQIAVLNSDFSGTPYSFDLAGVDRYNNTTWHTDHQSAGYRAATRQGGANALNIWLVDFKYLGIATFPWDYAKKGEIDGIRVNFDSLPGGSITNFNLGGTATHEAGHWFGLYHTFQGGCTELNDEVADTPAQSGPTSGCPEGRDSCPLPGLDPIHNYMDYSYDSCYTEFTPGQTARMNEAWAAYRG
ncbi:MAG: zinc metalloprotease [Nocardioides sp.]